MKTLRERYIAALIKRGEKEVKRTNKFIVFTRTINGAKHGNYYIGKSGSLRAGYTSVGSTPCNDTLKKNLLAEVEG